MQFCSDQRSTTTCLICYLHPTPRTQLWRAKAQLADLSYSIVKSLLAGYQAERLNGNWTPADASFEDLIVHFTEGLCEDHAAFKELFADALRAMKM